MEDVSCCLTVFSDANKAMSLMSNYNNNTFPLKILIEFIFGYLTLLGCKIQRCNNASQQTLVRLFPVCFCISNNPCHHPPVQVPGVCLCIHRDLQLFHSLTHPPASWRGLRWRWRWGSDPSTPERPQRRANASFRCQETLRVSTN